MNNKKLVTILTLSLPLLVGLFILLWISSHGYIDVTTPSTSKSLTYIISNQSGDKISNTQSSTGHVKKMVKKGTFVVSVEGDNKSYFKVTKTTGFLSVTKVSASLQSEKSREFVGNNPNFCTYYGQDILYSYNCSEPGGLTVHLPATSSTPTTTLTEKEEPYIPLVGLLSVGGINKAVATDDEQDSVSVYDIDQQLRLANPVGLYGVKASDAQNVLPFKSGFLIYNSKLSKIDYFATPTSSSQSLNSVKPNKDTSNPAGLSTFSDQVGVLFNSGGDGGDDGLEASQTTTGVIGGTSQVITYHNGQSKSYTLDKFYTSGGVCGINKLCLVNSGVLDVYDTHSGKPLLVFSMKDVQRILSIRGLAIIATSNKVIALNPEDLSGATQFTYGSGQYCGINESANGYVLCQVTPKGDNVALYVDMGQTNTDSIDKKVYALLKSPDVSDVSVYKNFIYISPNLGQPVLNSTTQQYEYDPVIKASANKKINEAVKRAGINQELYTVINPLR